MSTELDTTLNTTIFIENFNKKIQALSERIQARLTLEQRFKQTVTDRLSDIKIKLKILYDNKEKLISLFDKASEQNKKIETQMAEKVTEINTLNSKLVEITTKNTLLEEELKSVNKQLTHASENSVETQKSLEAEKKQLQEDLKNNTEANNATAQQMTTLSKDLEALKNYNDNLKITMAKAVETLSTSLTKLEGNEVNPGNIEQTYNDILQMIDELSSIIENKPPTQPSVQPVVFEDNTLIQNENINYDTIGDLKKDLQKKAQQISPGSANKYANALSSIRDMKDLKQLDDILRTILNSTTKRVKGGKKTRYTKKIKKTRKTRKVRKHKKQRGGFTYSSSSRRVSPETRRTTLPLKSHKRHKKIIHKK